MTGLSADDYDDFARERVHEAQRALDLHVTVAYTGVCAACGRPGPCDERRAAEAALTRWSQRPHRHNRTAVSSTAASLEELRSAWLATCSAVIRAREQFNGPVSPLVGRALSQWERALGDGWAALLSAYQGMAHARRLPGVPPTNVGELVAGLRGARADADRAASGALAVRRALIVADDRLRYDGGPEALVVAAHHRRAIRRIDRLVARLSIGAIAVDRYVTGLTTPTPEPEPAPPRVLARPPDPSLAWNAWQASTVLTAERRRGRARGGRRVRWA